MVVTAFFIPTVEVVPGSAIPVQLVCGSVLYVIRMWMLGLSYREFVRFRRESFKETI